VAELLGVPLSMRFVRAHVERAILGYEQ